MSSHCGDSTVAGLYCHQWAQITSGVFAMSAVIIAGWSIYKTCRDHKASLSIELGSESDAQLTLKYARKTLRTSIFVILGMTPVYAIACWLSIMFKNGAIEFDLIREMYEALAILAFYQFLISFLGGHLLACDRLMKKYSNVPLPRVSTSTSTTVDIGDLDLEGQLEVSAVAIPHAWPLSLLWKNGWRVFNNEFMTKTRHGILQYPVIRLTCACITFALQLGGIYGNGSFAFDRGYIYIATITNFSQMIGMYSLYQVYWAFHDELKPINPFPKFCYIKLVVFATFWQSVLLAGLSYLHVVPETTTYTQEDVATGLQNFIIAIEMTFAALFHAYAFPSSEFSVGSPTYNLVGLR